MCFKFHRMEWGEKNKVKKKFNFESSPKYKVGNDFNTCVFQFSFYQFDISVATANKIMLSCFVLVRTFLNLKQNIFLIQRLVNQLYENHRGKATH